MKRHDEAEHGPVELPQGWRSARLGDVCVINPRRPTLDRADDALTTFVPMPAVSDTEHAITGAALRPYGEIRKGYTYFADGDVLFAKITPCMQNGKHAVACDLTDGIGFGSTEFHVLRPTDAVMAEWIHQFLIQPRVLQDATAHFKGAVGQQRVPDTYLADLVVPLPPVEEQKRILTALNDRLATVQKARALAQEQMEAARALPAAYMVSAFESPKARSWPLRRIGDIAVTCSGSTPSRTKPEYYTGDIPWVKTGELRDGVIADTEEHVNDIALQETSLRLLPAGTLLVAMYGQGQTRGRTGLLARPATTNQACFAIVPGETFETKFLQYWFRHNYLRIREESEGRGGNQPNLNGLLLKNQRVPVPSVSVQRRIVAELDTALEVARAVTARIGEQIAALDALKTAYLRDAFAGRLVEEKVVTVAPKATVGKYYKQAAIWSYYVNRIHHQPTTGSVKLEKLAFFTEAYAGFPMGGVYRRAAAGPFDADIHKMESLARKQGWFTRQPRPGGKGHTYRPGTHIAKGVEAAKKMLGDRLPKVDRLIALFAEQRTEFVEVIATLYGVWNDFLLDGGMPTDDAIIREVRENWHVSKERFTAPMLQKALDWMRRNDLVPTGTGPHTEVTNG